MAALKPPNDDLVKGAAIALGAVTLGFLLYQAFRPKPALAAPGSPGPSGPPSGGGVPGSGSPPPPPPPAIATQPTDVVADPTALSFALPAIVGLAPSYGYAAPTTTSLTDPDVVAAVQSFQKYENSGTSPVTPPLRTDGVIDWRTWAGLVVSNTLRGNFTSLHLENAVTDPSLVQMAQNAAATLPQKSVASVLGVTAGNTTTQIVQALQKWIASQGVSVPTDGTITYFTLALLITLAYGT